MHWTRPRPGHSRKGSTAAPARIRNHAAAALCDFTFSLNLSQRFFWPATILALPSGDNLEIPSGSFMRGRLTLLLAASAAQPGEQHF